MWSCSGSYLRHDCFISKKLVLTERPIAGKLHSSPGLKPSRNTLFPCIALWGKQLRVKAFSPITPTPSHGMIRPTLLFGTEGDQSLESGGFGQHYRTGSGQSQDREQNHWATVFLSPPSERKHCTCHLWCHTVLATWHFSLFQDLFVFGYSAQREDAQPATVVPMRLWCPRQGSCLSDATPLRSLKHSRLGKRHPTHLS